MILDTCALLSLIGFTPKRLSTSTLRSVHTAEYVYLSSCSLFEIAIKHKKRGMDLGGFGNPQNLWNAAVHEYQLTELTVSHDIFYEAVLLPDFHADPFDRIIIAHARKEGIPVATFDATFRHYGVTVIE